MKALVIHAPGDLRLEEHETRPPGPHEVSVKIATGGVCGSDLHYYNHGGFGTVKLKAPMILGHEVAGHVSAVGEEVTSVKEGDLVAVSPSRPCYGCRFCDQGQHNHCLNMRFYGSAMPWPHIQGAFRQQLVATEAQCVVANGLTTAEAAMAEPFAVVLHAARTAGDLLGKRVLVTGCGPIGVLAIIAARRAGAVEIVATDLADNALSHAATAGADRVINTGTEADALSPYAESKGYFDCVFECSGSVHALTQGIQSIKPHGVIMQLGLGGDMTLPMMQITAKELQLKGSFRFHHEFQTAVDLMQAELVDLKPFVTHTVDLENAVDAFVAANDRHIALKTQIRFD